MEDKLKSLYVDMASWDGINVDDFIVAIGKNKSNSVYHVYSVRVKPNIERRINRNYLKVFKSDLITALKRDESQNLITVYWYSRNKKK